MFISPSYLISCKDPSFRNENVLQGESEQAFKKQCTTNTATKKIKQKSTQVQPKDPQSIAAKVIIIYKRSVT